MIWSWCDRVHSWYRVNAIFHQLFYKLRKYSLENVRGIVSAEGRGEELQDAQLHARCLKGIYRKKMAAVWKMFGPI
jgi:hypothetical protein